MNQHPLKVPFYDSYDASAVHSVLERLSALSENARRQLPNFLGEGLHFQSFALASSPLPLVLNIAKESFLARSPADIARWRKAMLDLRHIDDAALVPPMEVVRSGELLAIVMPRGERVKKGAAYANQIEEKLLATARALGKAGLALDDYPQILEQGGVPFINDWSDLASVSR